MGGLLTTATDRGKYVAFRLSAWPARDDPEAGPEVEKWLIFGLLSSLGAF
jgi:hypothetical protein